MKKIFFTILIFGLIIVVWGQTMNPSTDKPVETQNTNKCSPVVDGLQFCSASTSISINSGQEVKIDVFLQNTTDKSVAVVNGQLTDSYNVVVKNADGNAILSKMEKLNKEVKEGKIPIEELIRQLPINSTPRKINLEPQQKLNVEFNLSDYYELKAKGRYLIEISRKIPAQDGVNITELSFGTINVEIK